MPGPGGSGLNRHLSAFFCRGCAPHEDITGVQRWDGAVVCLVVGRAGDAPGWVGDVSPPHPGFSEGDVERIPNRGRGRADA
jgi:hypothetical protein